MNRATTSSANVFRSIRAFFEDAAEARGLVVQFTTTLTPPSGVQTWASLVMSEGERGAISNGFLTVHACSLSNPNDDIPVMEVGDLVCDILGSAEWEIPILDFTQTPAEAASRILLDPERLHSTGVMGGDDLEVRFRILTIPFRHSTYL